MNERRWCLYYDEENNTWYLVPVERFEEADRMLTAYIRHFAHGYFMDKTIPTPPVPDFVIELDDIEELTFTNPQEN